MWGIKNQVWKICHTWIRVNNLNTAFKKMIKDISDTDFVVELIRLGDVKIGYSRWLNGNLT